MFQMTKKYSILAAFLFCALFFVACGDSDSSSVPDEFTDPIITPEESEPDSITEPDTTTGDSVENYPTKFDSSGLHTYILENGISSGNLYIFYPAESFLTKFEIGDIVTVAIEYTSDVPIAWFFFSAVAGSDFVSLSVHNGSFSEIIGITAQNAPIEVNVSLKEKGGFLFGLEMRYAQYLDVYPERYPELSIEEYANFREIRTTGMGEKKLYRSSSPIDNCLGRSLYADSLAKEAGIATFINLTDTEDYAKTYQDYDSSYYSKQNVIYLSLAVEFFSRPFKDGLVKGFRYMGAKTEELQADYAKTFSNYFNVVNGLQVTYNEQQAEFFENVVVRNLRAVYHADGIEIPDADDID